jgi:hypothetical protein
MAHRLAPILSFLVLATASRAQMGCVVDAADTTDAEPAVDRQDGVASPITSAFQKGVSPAASYAGVVDTTLRQSAPTTAAGASGTVSADYDDPAGSLQHTSGLLKFDLGSIPAGSKVTKVTLEVNVTNKTSGSGYVLYPLSRAWSESQATWQAPSSGKSWAAVGARGSGDRGSAAIGSLAPTVTGKAKVTLNAAGIAAVQSWVDQPSNNFGFVIDTDNNYDGLQFDSSNASVAANRPSLVVTYSPAAAKSPYPVYTQAEVDAWSTSNPEYTRLANSWAGNVNRAYASYGTQVSSTERDVLKDEAVYIKTQAVLWAADGNAARRNKVIALLDDMGSITSWQWDSVEQYRLVSGWASTNLAQAAAIVGYHDPDFTNFLVEVNYPIMDWPGSNNWNASFADSKLAIAVYVGDEDLYEDAKEYFYSHIAQSNYHSAYDGNKVKPCLGSNGTPSSNVTIRNWGGYWGAAQVKADYTFVNPGYVTDGFNAETIRDLGHVSMGLGAWMHAARTIRAHGDVLEQHAYDRLHAAYTLHAHRVLTYKNTGTIPAPVPVKGDGGGSMNQSWRGAKVFFGSDTPAEVTALCNHADVKTYPAAGANHLVAEPFADGQ